MKTTTGRGIFYPLLPWHKHMADPFNENKNTSLNTMCTARRSISSFQINLVYCSPKSAVGGKNGTYIFNGPRIRMTAYLMYEFVSDCVISRLVFTFHLI